MSHTRDLPLPKVLTLADYYLPGCKGGGPITTLANLVDRLGKEFSFQLLTRDHDLGDSRRYDGIAEDLHGVRCGRAQVHYLPRATAGRKSLGAFLARGAYDVLYLNSLYSLNYSILPLAWMFAGRVPSCPVVLAPRGELSQGARSIKRWKKSWFLAASRVSGFHNRVLWQASSAFEEQDIRAVFGKQARVRIAPDLTSAPAIELANIDAIVRRETKKRTGSLRLLFVGRVCRMKNLRLAVEAAARLTGNVELRVVGPIEEPAYWEECRKSASVTGSTLQLTYGGVVRPADMSDVMRDYDFLILPTFGENFGHVVAEAMSVGTPVVISDRTPWRNLAATSAGWDFSLERPDELQRILRHCESLAEEEHQALRLGARRYWAERIADDSVAVEQNRRLFREALNTRQNDSSARTVAA